MGHETAMGGKLNIPVADGGKLITLVALMF